MAADRILITGATGFVGRHLVANLVAARQRLVLAVRDADACPAEWRSNPDIRIVETGPLETAPGLDGLLAGAGTVVHLAALAHARQQSAAPFMTANAVATQRLCRAAETGGARRFIHLGSIAAITGNVSGSVVDDGTTAAPTTAYGRSKLEAERHVAALAGKGMFAVSLRPPLVVGAEAKGNWSALQKIAASGLPLPFASVRNRRSMLDVALLVRAIALLCARDWPVDLSGGYCIANRDAMALPEMVAGLRQGMGLPARLVAFPPALLAAALRISGRQRIAAGLFGTLEVDGSRFGRVFGLEERRSLAEAVGESGRLYARLSQKPSGVS